MTSPSRRARTVVALVMTLWTVLQGTTLVVAAIRGGEPADAFRYVYTGMLTMALVALCVVAWRWVARATPYVLPPRAGEPTARTPTEPEPDAPAPEPPSHHGLTGRVPPPQRW